MVNLLRALMPRDEKFFQLFSAHAGIVVSAAEAMKLMLEGGVTVPEQCARVVALEHDADVVTRQTLMAVRRTFITPFDRGDIRGLIMAMDDTIDMMQRTANTVALYDQTRFPPQMVTMGGLIVEAARLVAEAVPLLERMNREAPRLTRLTDRVVRVEQQADDLYEEGLKALYHAHRDGEIMAFIVGHEIYGLLEQVVDRFEDVANEINGIVIENV